LLDLISKWTFARILRALPRPKEARPVGPFFPLFFSRWIAMFFLGPSFTPPPPLLSPRDSFQTLGATDGRLFITIRCPFFSSPFPHSLPPSFFINSSSLPVRRFTGYGTSMHFRSRSCSFLWTRAGASLPFYSSPPSAETLGPETCDSRFSLDDVRSPLLLPVRYTPVILLPPSPFRRISFLRWQKNRRHLLISRALEAAPP